MTRKKWFRFNIKRIEQISLMAATTMAPKSPKSNHINGNLMKCFGRLLWLLWMLQVSSLLGMHFFRTFAFKIKLTVLYFRTEKEKKTKKNKINYVSAKKNDRIYHDGQRATWSIQLCARYARSLCAGYSVCVCVVKSCESVRESYFPHVLESFFIFIACSELEYV